MALILLPLVLLAFNHYWIYSTIGTLDPWIYAGYQMHPARLWSIFPTAYYGSRVPWIIFGWAVHRVADVEPALYIQALTLFYLSTLSLFYTVQRIFARPAAAFAAAALLGTNTWFLSSIGWDYIDGPMIALILLGFAALSGAALGQRWRTAALLWGATSTATVSLFTPNLIIVLPIQMAVFAGLNYLGARRNIVRVSLFWLTGCVVSFFLTCLVTWALGGHFFFFAAQANASIVLLQHLDRIPPWTQWIGIAPWLLLPAFALIGSLIVLVVRGPAAARRLSSGQRDAALVREGKLLVLAAACVLACLGFMLMEAMRLGMLAYHYHANELYPFAFLVIGGALAAIPSGRSRIDALLIVLGAVVFCIEPWVMHGLHVPSPVFIGNTVEPLWMLAGGALLAAAAFSRNAIVPLVFIAFLSFVSYGSGPKVWATSRADGEALRDRALAMYDMSAFVDRNEPNRYVKIWWELSDPDWPTLNSFGEMMYLEWDPLHKPPALVDGKRILLLSSNGSIPEIESHLVGRQPFQIVPIATGHVQRGTLGMDMVLADIVAREVLPDLARYDRVTIPLSAFHLPVNDGHIRIDTSDKLWASAAAYVIDGSYKRPHPTPAYLDVRLRTETGLFGVWLTTDDGKAWFGSRAVPASSSLRHVYLPIPAFKNAQIVFGNGGTTDKSSATIYSIDLLYERSPARKPAH